MHDAEISTARQLAIGDGPTRAVLVHGNDLCGPFYRPLAERLAARGVNSTLLTLPGFHGVPPLPQPSWLGMVEAVLTALPPGPATLIGHSMGGVVALLTAARRPPALTRLVLLEPAVFPNRWLARMAARRYLASVVRGDRDQFVNWNGATRRIADPAHYPQAAIDLYLEVRRTSDAATAEALFTSLPNLYPLPYDRIDVPTMMIVGSATGWRARAMMRPLVRALGAHRVTVAGAAHWLINEADDEVARHIAEFVQ